MQATAAAPDGSLDEKLEVLAIARELWQQAGREPEPLANFWEAAERQFASRRREALGGLAPPVGPEHEEPMAA